MRSIRRRSVAIGLSVFSAIVVALALRINNKNHGGLFDSLDSAWISIENLFTGVRTEPTSKANPFLLADLEAATERLLGSDSAAEMTAYQEFPRSAWPSELQQLNPIAVVYFNSDAEPDADGILIVVERRRDWDSGILILRQRRPEWRGTYMNGQIVKAGPDFGFRRLRDDGQFWHWYRRSGVTSLQGATSDQPAPAPR